MTMLPVSLNVDPAALPLREIHLPESVDWWPLAPGWWILLGLVLLGCALVWYSCLLYNRHRYSAVNVARRELAGIKSRYAVDRDAGHCVRSVSGLLRRLCISVFPRNESAGLTGAEWLAFLRSGTRDQEPGNSERSTGEIEQDIQGFMPEKIGRLLLEAPYRRDVGEDEVEALIGFCSDWINAVARSPGKKSGLARSKP